MFSSVGPQVFYFNGKDVVRLDEKILDKNANLKQNQINMKTTMFNTAVLVAIGEVRRLKPSGFSVHDVTKHLRSQVNNGQIAFSDRTTEDVDGVDTFHVSHEDVKDVFNDYYQNGALDGLDRRNTGSFWEYFEVPPVAVPPIATNAPVASVVLPQPTKPTTSLTSSFDTTSSFAESVRSYLNDNPNQDIPLKRVQSRFKGIYLTCEEYAILISQLGFNIRKNGNFHSKWEVLT